MSPFASATTAVQFLVHAPEDNVAVAVADGLRAGARVLGAVVDAEAVFSIDLRADIPFGHKIALSALAEGDAVVKQGAVIGRLAAPVARGDLVHVHNLKTQQV